MEQIESPSARWESTFDVCPSHFWGLTAAGYEQAATVIARHTVHEWLARLDYLRAGMARQPAPGPMDRLAAVPVAWSQRLDLAGTRSRTVMAQLWRIAAETLESPEHKLDRVRVVPFRKDLCQACWHINETTRRTLDLILRIVEEPAGRQAYRQGWGLCLRHCIAAANIADSPAALHELLKGQISRLRILEWDLEESSRKINWSVRYEPKGPEENAWQRAAYQFCGSAV